MVLWQLILNSLYHGCAYFLVTASFALICRTSRFFNFSHAFSVSIGPYAAWVLCMQCHVPLYVSAFLGVLTGGVCGLLMDMAVFQVLRRQKASSLVLLLASLGLYIVLQNVLSLIFGDETKSLRTWEISEGLDVLGARVTWVQVSTALVALLVFVSLRFLLKSTQLGLKIRAVAEDQELASVCGVADHLVIRKVMLIGSALAAMAGILIAMDVGMSPTMGMAPLMFALVVVIVVGTWSISSIAMVSILITAIQQIATWNIGAEWQEVSALVILILVLVLRPHGLLHKNNLKTTT